MTDLITLAGLDAQPLEWRQPALGRTFELTGPTGTHARLELKKLAGSVGLGTVGLGNTARVSFAFERQGMLKSYINIRFTGSDARFAVYEPHFTGQKGQLKYPGGQSLEFQSTNFFATEWQWVTHEGDGLIGFKASPTGKPNAKVFLSDDVLDRVDSDLLLLLGFYLLLLSREAAESQSQH